MKKNSTIIEKEDNIFIDALNKAKNTVEYFKKCSDDDINKIAELTAENEILNLEVNEYSKVLDNALNQITILKTEKKEIKCNDFFMVESSDVEKTRQLYLSDKYNEKKIIARDKLNCKLEKLQEKMKILYEKI